MYVTEGSNGGQVLRYDATTGAPAPGPGLTGADFIDPFSHGLIGTSGIVFGPDGNLSLTGNGTKVLRYSPSGAFIDTFVASGGGGGLAFGPDGNLYATDGSGVHRFFGPNGPTPGAADPAPGQAGAIFVPDFPNAGGLTGSQDLVFGPDGNLYVTDHSGHAVYRYNGTTGAFDPAPDQMGATYVSDPNLVSPWGLVFGADGNLYAASFGFASVLRYQGPGGLTPGAFINAFVPPFPSPNGSLQTPTGLRFGPDGNLYVDNDSGGNPSVKRYNGATGAYIDDFIGASNRDGLGGPLYLTFDPAPVNGIPEPGTSLLVGIVLTGVALAISCRSRKPA